MYGYVTQQSWFSCFIGRVASATNVQPVQILRRQESELAPPTFGLCTLEREFHEFY